MADISFADMAHSAGSTTGSVLTDAANAAADLACDLYHAHSSWVVNKLDPTGISGAFGDGFMQNLCSPRPGYTPPGSGGDTVPLHGGQCALVCYAVSFSGYRETFSDQQHYPYASTIQVLGAIGSPKAGIVGAFSQSSFTHYGYCGNPGSQQEFVMAQIDKNVGKTVVESFSVQRVDGNADNCGNPPIPAPNPSELSRNITYNNTTVPVTLTNINAHSGLTFSVGKLNVNLGAGGGSVNPCACDPETDPSYDRGVDTSESDPKRKDGLSGLGYVCINISQVPLNEKIGYAGDAPDIFRAGWINFLYNGYAYERLQINHEKTIFTAPDRCDGYAYFLHPGFSGSATEIYPDSQP